MRAIDAGCEDSNGEVASCPGRGKDSAAVCSLDAFRARRDVRVAHACPWYDRSKVYESNQARRGDG